MEIRNLEYFLEVARTKSFTKAAQNLFITQPTISRMIKNLEDELEVELFERLGKGVELTDAGQTILLQAQNIVNSVRGLSGDLSDVMQLKKGQINIGLPPMIGANFFPRVVGEFNKIYPRIKVHLWEHGAKKVEDDVAAGRLEIGVTLLPVQEEVFQWFSFVKDKLDLVVHPSHRLAGKGSVALAELAAEEFILFQEDFLLHDRIINDCVSVGFQPRIAFKSTQWDFISEMVAANLGVALLPGTICRQLDKQRVCLLPLVQPEILWHLAVIWRKDRYLSFAAREWLNFTRQRLQEAGDAGTHHEKNLE